MITVTDHLTPTSSSINPNPGAIGMSTFSSFQAFSITSLLAKFLMIAIVMPVNNVKTD